MMKLVTLYGLEKMIERASRIYETGVISPNIFSAIYKRRQALFEELRPEVLTLVESFEYNDQVLGSAIGHSNGKPY